MSLSRFMVEQLASTVSHNFGGANFACQSCCRAQELLTRDPLSSEAQLNRNYKATQIANHATTIIDNQSSNCRVWGCLILQIVGH